MDKGDVILKVERLIGREVTVNKSIKHSSNHLDSFVNCKGILKTIDLGESYEDVNVSVEFVVSTGKKLEGRDNVLIWMDARDLVGVERS